MVYEITRLQFHTETYTGEDEYKSKHLIKEGASRYQGRQQGCPVTKRRIMAIKDNSRDHNDQKKMTVEESDILKKIKKNITKEKEVV